MHVRRISRAALPTKNHMTQAQQQDTPPWMDIAFSQHGVAEIKGPRANPKITAYHATTTLRASSDEVPWCSAFMNWCMLTARLKGTGSAKARSWLHWGIPLTFPRLGCIAVFRSPARGPEAGHVGIYWMERSAGEIWLYGGNHDNCVGLKSYSRLDLLGYRWPADYVEPSQVRDI